MRKTYADLKTPVVGTGLAVWGFVFVLVSYASSAEITVTTAKGKGADTELRYNNEEQGLGEGLGGEESIAIRWWPQQDVERNQVCLLRFDLNGVDPKSIRAVRLELTACGLVIPAHLGIYGLKHNVGDQLWDENKVTYSNAPGVQFKQGDFATTGIKKDQAKNFGEHVNPSLDDGDTLKFQSKLFSQYLQDDTWHTRSNDPNVITLILVMVEESSGRRNFYTKEAREMSDERAPRLVILTND